MARKSDFTENEWDALHKGVTRAGLLVSTSDRSLFDSFKEAGALARHLSDARKDNDSELVRELAQTRPDFDLQSPQDLERTTLESLRTAVSTLQSKAPSELDAYRGFVIDVAESVATAAAGGESAETEAIAKIRTALAAV